MPRSLKSPGVADTGQQGAPSAASISNAVATYWVAAWGSRDDPYHDDRLADEDLGRGHDRVRGVRHSRATEIIGASMRPPSLVEICGSMWPDTDFCGFSKDSLQSATRSESKRKLAPVTKGMTDKQAGPPDFFEGPTA